MERGGELFSRLPRSRGGGQQAADPRQEAQEPNQALCSAVHKISRGVGRFAGNGVYPGSLSGSRAEASPALRAHNRCAILRALLKHGTTT